MKLVFKKASEYRSEDSIGKQGIHCAPISPWEVEQVVEDAETHMFSIIYLYTDDRKLRILARKLSGSLVLIK